MRYVGEAHSVTDPGMDLLHCREVISGLGAGNDWYYTIIARYRQFADLSVAQPGNTRPGTGLRRWRKP